MEGVCVSGQRVSFGGKRPWRTALLMAIGSLCVMQPADAAIYYWHDSGPGFFGFAPPAPRKIKARRHPATKTVTENESAKPKGPLVIAISITAQKVRVYDANGLFAESPISTGMPGHPTPMGVFSVIQKHRFHHSNIYSGAPMPFMQRITWSGVALHAGVVPGHPASHGCIRMPAAFATKMWGWTKLGARVVITPGEIAPTNFSHSLLATSKVPPHPIATEEPKRDVAAARENEKASSVATAPGPTGSAAKNDPSPVSGDSAANGASLNMAAAPIGSATNVGVPQVEAPASKTMTVGSAEKSVDIVRPTTAVRTASNDPSLRDTLAKPSARPDPTTLFKPSGQIAVFVSRKDSKLYVRQNFSPLFDLPVMIATDERPLGTHVFTAQVDGNDSNALHWSVVSLPAPSKRADRRNDQERRTRGRNLASAAPVEAKVQPLPDSPTEALDRLNLPAEVMAKIFEAISTGGSIIVSDQGIAAGETGEGTDFIVSLR